MQNQPVKQRGGTLLGVVIGLVAGLAIALVVALMITKSPVPFNNKGKSDKPTTANMSPTADPNQPMYRNKAVAKEADPAKALEAQAVKNDAKPELPAAVKTETNDAISVKKLEEKAVYYLQAGAYKNPNDAESMRAKLALLGYEAGISEMISQGGTVYRVRVGPFTQVDTMNGTRAKLAENGVEVSIARIQK